MIRGLLLLAAVLMSYWGYHYLPVDHALRRPESWSFFICNNLLGCVGASCLLSQFRVLNTVGIIGTFACIIWLFEGGRAALCGLSASHDIQVPAWSDLCVEQYGTFPFELIASVALATLFVKPWEKNNGR